MDLLLVQIAGIVTIIAAVAAGSLILMGKVDFGDVAAWGCIGSIAISLLTIIAAVALTPLAFVIGVIMALFALIGLM